MKTITITKTINLFEYTELNKNAKENVKNWFLSDDMRTIFLYDDIKQDLEEKFKNSSLDVVFSLSYCQGDGLNIYGELNLYDFLNVWEASEKEKRTIKKYIDYSLQRYTFEENNRYCYSCKFIDKKYIDNAIIEFIEKLQYNNLKNIKEDIINNFFNDIINYFEELDDYYEKMGYDYLYNIDENEIIEACIDNDWLFTENGDIYYQ
jgi:hypothetical protein